MTLSHFGCVLKRRGKIGERLKKRLEKRLDFGPSVFFNTVEECMRRQFQSVDVLRLEMLKLCITTKQCGRSGAM